MDYYDHEDNVREYAKMAEGYDGVLLIEVLRKHLPAGSTVLELGMGPGKDLDMLSPDYKVTGSDTSRVFLDIYKRTHPSADLLLLDATSIDVDRTFDCIYSNKVLIHLAKAELRASFRRQAAALNRRGLAMHSFWYGDREDEEHYGLRFRYYTEVDLLGLASDAFEVVEMAVSYTHLRAHET